MHKYSMGRKNTGMVFEKLPKQEIACNYIEESVLENKISVQGVKLSIDRFGNLLKWTDIINADLFLWNSYEILFFKLIKGGGNCLAGWAD